MAWCKTLMLFLLGLSFTSCSHFPHRKYYYITTPKTWKDAQLYCRENHIDLAVFESMEDVNQLIRPADVTTSAWIGMHDDPVSWKGTMGNDSNSWRWSTTGQPITSQYTNWYSGTPSNIGGDRGCAYAIANANGAWNDIPCSNLGASVCYTDLGQNQKTYVFISTTMTWNDAQTYCRQHYTDLAVITSSEENTLAHSVMPSISPWIGLYRVPWTWSDKSPSTFTNWLSGQPDNNNENEHCAAEDDSHQWSDHYCDDPRPFLCYDVRKSETTMKLKFKRTAEMIDPAVMEQIRQKIKATFKDEGWTDFKLRWTTPPSKAQEKLQALMFSC